MSALQKRVKAIEKAAVGPLADQALRKLVQLQMR